VKVDIAHRLGAALTVLMHIEASVPLRQAYCIGLVF